MFNLSFLNSSALILSLSALLPLLIYLFAKKRPPRVVFSTILFIKESQKKQKKKMNLKNLLLLLIRILIILFTVLAISRPALKLDSLKSSSSHPPTAVAIVIDNSYSMDYVVDTQTELDKALQTASKIIEMLTTDDICVFFCLDSEWNEQNSLVSYGRFSDASLYSIQPSAIAQKPLDVIREAESKLQESNLPNREIYFITDLQAADLPSDLNTPLFIIPSSPLENRDNLSVESARLGTSFVERGIEKQIDYILVNNSAQAIDDVICSLVLDGVTVAESVTDIEGGQRLQSSFAISLENPGWHSGYVNVKDERLFFDNRYYFGFYYNHKPSVAVITSNQELPSTLRAMLNIYTADKDNIQIINNNLNVDRLSGYENIIVWDYDNWDGQLQFVLANLQQQNQKILVIADRELSQKAQEILADEFDLDEMELSVENENYTIREVNSFHPAAIRLDSSRPAEIVSLWKTKSTANVILSAQNYPLALENRGNILWLFDIAQLRSSFLVDANFPVLAYNSLQYTAASGQISSQYRTGDLFRPRYEPLYLPDGSAINTGGRKLKLSYPGLYGEGEDKLPLAANLDFTESRFSALEIPSSNWIKLCDENWAETIFQARYGYELWKYLLAAALILVALEIFIIKSEERKG